MTSTTPETTAPGYAVRDYVDTEQLKRDLTYTPNDLSSAMMVQAGLFSHYGILFAQASKQVDVVKLLLENTEAAVYQMLRAKALQQGEKLTEVQLEKAVSREPRVIAMKKALAEAKQVEGIARTAMEAFRHRKDMLVSQGLISREEMKGDLRINGGKVQQDQALAMHRAALGAQ
ncbi:hypothetical protein [Paracoccus litorisediminis]|uniref:Uncharacterized protein n=1 Tax=Paracoccus litorisediminis TaxID=2006130 RepID=A0A844HSB3_9RHOB|nr:hypothetical protein [Paracoccus litorisediminis]MTH61095.1 hypothetical protein [Paracoccus litorisediminis]